MIVKIQKPLAGGDEAPPALVYNEDRSYETLVEFSEGLRMTIGDREKIYCEVKLEDGNLVLLREVRGHSW